MQENNLKKYLICILLGALFHVSVVIMIPFFFLKNIKLTPKKTIIFLGVSLVLANVLRGLIFLVASNIPKYSVYLNLTDQNSFELGLVILFVITLLCVILNNDSNRLEYSSFWNGIIIMGVCFSILSGSIPLVSRILIYAKGVFVFYLPDVIGTIENRHIRRSVLLCVLGIFTAYFVYNVFIANWYGAIPYKNVFSR